MNKSKIVAVTAISLALSMSGVSFSKVFSKDLSSNIAVVDIQRIIESSPEINALKSDRKNKVVDLASYITKARTDVAKESNATKKKALEVSYTKEINSRKSSMDQDYVKKLSDVDKEISGIIKSKTSNYDLVLTKSSVIEGGTDVTDQILKELK